MNNITKSIGIIAELIITMGIGYVVFFLGYSAWWILLVFCVNASSNWK